jgi:hypothetical protein
MSSSKSGQWTERAITEFDKLVMGRQLIVKAVVLPQPNSPLPTVVELLRPTSVAKVIASIIFLPFSYHKAKNLVFSEFFFDFFFH